MKRASFEDAVGYAATAFTGGEASPRSMHYSLRRSAAPPPAAPPMPEPIMMMAEDADIMDYAEEAEARADPDDDSNGPEVQLASAAMESVKSSTWSSSASNTAQDLSRTGSPNHPTGSTAKTGPSVGKASLLDLTIIPTQMDKAFERLDKDSALRPTIINPGDVWTRTSKRSLLGKSSTEHIVSTAAKKKEMAAAFDLLDALTLSGALPLDHASLHVVIAATHTFDKAVVDSVVRDNVSPIHKVERSTLIMASTLHQRPVKDMVLSSELLSKASKELVLA